MSFKSSVDRFIEEGSEPSMEALVQYSRTRSISDEDIAYLASSCANASGSIWSNMSRAADIASTGGPTSLTTLLCPLYLRAFGHDVPKLGVPGRPAGGIDVLAQIPNFKFALTDLQATDALRDAGYVHFLAGEHHGRHDALLFEYRKRNNAVRLAPLVIASLLTKKLIVGLLRVGLDVRVSPFGNFGATWGEAKINAKRFCDVARLVGISAFCFLTDSSIPYQPYIGRGESLVALSDIFAGKPSKELCNHLDLCYAIARGTTDTNVARPTIDTLRLHFEQNLKAQGASMSAFFDKANTVTSSRRFSLTAYDDGFLDMNMEVVRQVLISVQSAGTTPTDIFPDPIGLILQCYQGDYIRKGDVIATVRADESFWPQLRQELSHSLRFCRTPTTSRYFEEVTNG